MLQPYATVKPHGDACPHRHGPITLCHPRGPGHNVCQNAACPGRAENNGAGRIAALHTLIHATAEQYAALPLPHIPIDGIAHQAVFMCDECAEDTDTHDRFCTHAEPLLPPCPKCGAEADQPCLRKDGATPLGFSHTDRPPLVYDVCRHAHRPDCPIFDGCPCTGDDQPPVRPPHPARLHIDGPGPDVSRMVEPQITIPLLQALLAQQGIHWWQVRRGDTRLTQENQPCLWAEIAELDDNGHLRYDDHGHEILREIVIPVDAAPRGQLTPPAPALPPIEMPPSA